MKAKHRLLVLVALLLFGTGAIYGQTCTTYPSPLIQTDFSSHCEEKGEQARDPKRPDECLLACENMEIDYFTQEVPGHTYDWVVFGGTITGYAANDSRITVQWGSAGAGIIQVTETNPNLPNGPPCITTTEVCVEILVSPVADFTSIPAASGGVITICQGDDVNFYDATDPVHDVIAWEWDFGDGGFSNDQDPVYQFNTPGTYTVTLTVYNECGCSDTKDVTVKVLDSEVPIIACISTVCEKDEATYSVTNACPSASYQWTILSGGHFTPGGGTTSTDPNPTVVWDNPVDGQGILQVLVTGCNNSCPVPTQVIIPIITNNLGGISGPTVVCVDETVQYSLPPQPNNTFTWLVTPVSGTNFSVVTNYGSMIEVYWTQPGDYVIRVQPQFGDLRCNFDYEVFELNVSVRMPFDMNPDVATICENDDVTFALNPSVSAGATWEAIDENGVSTPIPGTSGISNTFNGSLLGPGTYEIRATDLGSEYCNSFASALLTIEDAAPAITGGITGDTDVCDGSTYAYSATPDPNHYLEWTVSAGSTLNGGGTTAIGDNVSATFNGGGPYTLSVVQIPLTPPSCPSPAVSLTINEIVPSAPAITGPNTVCADVTNNYSVTAPVGATNYEWSISPAFIGSVVSGQYSPSADIQFHQHPTQNTAIVTLNTTICNQVVTSTFNVNITDPQITVTAPTVGCQGDLITFTGNSTIGGSIDWDWDFGDSQTGMGSPVGHIYNGPGSYGIMATAEYTTGVCAGTVISTNHQINIKPEPLVFVTGTNGLVLCPANGIFNTTLVASVTALPDSPGPFFYSWSTGAMGTGATSITVSSAGTYTLTVTDQTTGCQNEFSVRVTTCGVVPPCPAPAGSLDFNVTENCNTLTFVENITVPYVNVTWDFGDGNSGAGATVSNDYKNSGYYVVTMFVELPSGDICSYSEQVIVEFVPNFIYEVECNGSNQLQVNLIDQTDYLSTISYSSFSFSWNVPTVGTLSGPTPSAVFATGGTYNVQLTVTLGGVSCPITLPVEAPDAPTATIDHDAPACVDQAINFDALGASPDSDFNWVFGDGTTSMIKSPSKAFSTPGVKGITLTETDEWGCTATGFANVVVFANNLAVSIDPTNPVCANTNLSLTGNVTGANTSFSWEFQDVSGSPSFGSGAVPATSGTVNSITIPSSGDYILTVTDLRGCVAQSNVESVVIVPVPPAPIVGLDGYCEGDNIVLTTVPGYIDYSWNGNSTGTNNTYTIFNAFQGPQNVTLVVDNGTCTNTNTFSTTVHDNPVVNIVVDPTGSPNCVPVGLLADDIGSEPITAWAWSNGSSTSTTTATVGGQIQVVAYSDEGCTDTDLFTVGEGPDLSDLRVGCYCLENLSTTWQGPVGPGYNYQWYFNGSPISGATGPTYDMTTVANGGMGPGVYNLEVTNSFGCSTFSDDIIIDMGENCSKCKFKVDLKDIECVGFDAINGGYMYSVTVSVFNIYASLAGFAGSSSQGFVHNGTMNPPTIPGNNTTTLVTFNFTLYSGQTSAIINFQGAGANGVSCNYELILEEFPDCEQGEPCKLKFFEAKVECLYTYSGNSYYSYELPISNLGNTVTNLTFVPCTNGVTITTSTTTLPNSLSTIVSGNIIAPNGTGSICVKVLGYDPITGQKCEWEIEIRLPDCKEVAFPCQSTVQDVKIECGNPSVDPYGYGNYIIDVVITSQMFNGNMIIKPTTTMPENLVSMISSSVSGNVYTASFLVVDVPADNDPLCFGVFIHAGHDVCITKFCVKKPDCKKAGGRSSDFTDFTESPSGFVIDGEMQISPNPASTAVQVNYELPTTGMTEVRMIRVDGQLVQHLRGLAQQDQITLDVSQLSPGLYTILLLQDGQLKAAEKVVVSGQK